MRASFIPSWSWVISSTDANTSEMPSNTHSLCGVDNTPTKPSSISTASVVTHDDALVHAASPWVAPYTLRFGTSRWDLALPWPTHPTIVEFGVVSLFASCWAR